MAAHSGITKALPIVIPSFDTFAVYWHNLTYGGVGSAQWSAALPRRAGLF
jgi:hypothetical protein